MPGTPGHSGGARLGAGRKSQARHERIEPTIEQLDQRLQPTIDARIHLLEQLAAGGRQTIIERWQRAGDIFVAQIEEELDSESKLTGETVTRKTRGLPGKPADELVLVSRIVKTLAPNLAANIYLVNRLVGAPAPVDAPETEDDPNPLPEELDDLVTRLYGSANN